MTQKSERNRQNIRHVTPIASRSARRSIDEMARWQEVANWPGKGINTAVFVPKMRAWLAVGGRTEDDKMARSQDRKMVEVRRANR